MLLRDFMRDQGLGDAEMAEKIGGISISGIRKLRYRERGPSVRVSARIMEISGGKVSPSDMQPLKKVEEAEASITTSPVLA